MTNEEIDRALKIAREDARRLGDEEITRLRAALAKSEATCADMIEAALTPDPVILAALQAADALLKECEHPAHCDHGLLPADIVESMRDAMTVYETARAKVPA